MKAILLLALAQGAPSEVVKLTANRCDERRPHCEISWNDGRGTVTRREPVPASASEVKYREWTGTFERKELDELLKKLDERRGFDLKAARCSRRCGLGDGHVVFTAQLDARGKKASLDACSQKSGAEDQAVRAIVDALLEFAARHAARETGK